MLSTLDTLRRRTGRFGVGRQEYLKQLLNEYEHSSTDDDNKLQILANFANFSYDPINYDYFRQLNIIDLFLDCLRMHTENDFAHYALAGLCNLSADRTNSQLILEKHPSILVSLVRCLFSHRLDIVLNGMLTSMFLADQHEQFRHEIKQRLELRQCLEKYSQSKESRLANMSKLFLVDYFS
jgi:armadillo repeat-containing protein 7